MTAPTAHTPQAGGRPRAPAWSRWVGDGALVAALLVLNVVSTRSGPDSHLAGATVFVTSAVVIPLLVRRRWPMQVFVTVIALCGVQFLLQVYLRPGDLAALVALYTLYAYRGGSPADIGTGVCATGLLAEFWQYPSAHSWADLIAPMVALTGVAVVGRTIGIRRGYLQALEERAERLESERDALARAAVAEERARIAREMHDVVAHRVGVIVAQADGAKYAFHAHPEQARAALDVIADAGRAALTELRQLLGVLRSTDGPDHAPQPGTDDLDALVAHMREAGLPVRFTTSGTLDALPRSLGLTVYRVVQEALTNTLKHAGPGTPVKVTIEHTPSSIRVRVLDAGDLPPGDLSAGGHGLIGMRERVTMLGGTFTAAHVKPCGFDVDVTIPAVIPE